MRKIRVSLSRDLKPAFDNFMADVKQSYPGYKISIRYNAGKSRLIISNLKPSDSIKGERLNRSLIKDINRFADNIRFTVCITPKNYSGDFSKRDFFKQLGYTNKAQRKDLPSSVTMYREPYSHKLKV